ncbi:cupin domain-containing protein [bacterium]|nr:cupin domain-containing protein [bacterium]
MKDKAVNLKERLDKIVELWSPRVVGEVNDTYIKLVKIKGELAWHRHADEDEMFLVLRGNLRIEMESSTVELSEGDFFVVPQGAPHNPVSEEGCEIILIEPKTTRHTGDTLTERTKSIAEQLKAD